MANNKVVLGIYTTRAAVERAVDRLKNSGFSSGDISALLPDSEGSREFAHEKATKAPEGAASGAATGAVIGGTLGWLAGIGAVAIPGVGPLIAAGPIMALLAGAGVGGTVGGIAGGLVGLGFPEYEARRYEGRIREGGILLSVHCETDDEQDEAEEILEQTGAQEISASSEYEADEEVHDTGKKVGNY